MEVLGRRRAVGHADVPLRAELEEALEPAARVLRPRPLVAVGQEQRQPRVLAPLGEPGHDELVDDHLRGVHEVAELRLPADKHVARLRAVAVLERDTRVLRQRAVVELERDLGLREALDRAPPLAGLRVVEDEMALAERAALGVLTGEPHRHALGEERCPRERLRVRPIDRPVLERRAPPLDLRPQLPVHLEPFRHS